MNPYNVKGILANVYDATSWNPGQSASSRDLLIRMLNRAYLEIVSEAPYLFFEETHTLTVYPTYQPVDGDVLVWRGQFLLRRKEVVGTYDSWIGANYINYWAGRIVQVVVPSGLKIEARIRAVFTGVDPDDGLTYEWITLFDHIDFWSSVGALNSTRKDDDLEYIIYNKDIMLPQALIKLNNVLFENNSYSWEGQVITQEEADYRGYRKQISFFSSAEPFFVYRGGVLELSAPLSAPVITNAASNWGGQEPGGTFEYCYTFGYGLRDPEATGPVFMPTSGDLTGNAFKVAMFESPPSPVSDVKTITYGSTGAKITPESYWYTSGYQSVAGTEIGNKQAGVITNVYRRRKSTSASASPALSPIGPTEHFRLIGQIGVESNDVFINDLGRFPNPNAVLKHNHAVELMGIYPPPTQKFLVTIRGIFTPDALVDDTDVPKLKPEGLNLLMCVLLKHFYKRMGKATLSATEQLEANRLYAEHAKKYGVLKPGTMFVARSPAAGFTGRPHATKVWWTTNGNS